MRNKNIKKFFSIILLASFFIFVCKYNIGLTQSSCPLQTTYSNTYATLVGEITDTGGDPNISAWFEWGKSSVLENTTPIQSLYVSNVPYRFCYTIDNLQPCTTYYYRAVAKNSAGTTRGSIQSFTTQCNPIYFDLKINGSDGPLSVDYNTPLNITWTSNSATYCTASGAWTGNKTTSGSETISNLNIGNYTFTLTCKDNTGRQTSDSVNVTIKAKLPNVITLPPVTTL